MSITRQSTERATSRGGDRFGWLLVAGVPAMTLLLLVVFAWHTSRQFGAWPSYGDPDPKAANSFLYTSTGVGLLASAPSVFLLIAGLFVARRARLTRLDFALIIFAVVGLVLLFFVFAGNLGNWYMD